MNSTVGFYAQPDTDAAMDRRRFLTGVGSAGFGGLSGCSEFNLKTSPIEDTDTSPTPHQSAPQIYNFEYSLDDPETAVENRTLQLRGEANIGPDGIVGVSLSDGTDVSVKEERFETTIDIDGGQRYTFTATASNESGSVSETLDLGYIPAPTAKVPEERLIGAHYYVWWGADWHWEEGYPGKPVLGEYNARNPSVLDQHISWALKHGITWFSVSWWGRDSWSDVTLRDYFPRADRSDEIEISILYEPHATLDTKDGWRVDFDDPGNREQFTEDIAYLAETYFERDNYLHLDDRPVVYIYLAQGFIGGVDQAIERVTDVAGVRPYLIGDFDVVKGEPVIQDLLGSFDAVSDYASFYEDRPDVAERYPDDVIDETRQWMLSLDDEETTYIPDLGPAFDKSHHSAGQDLAILDPSSEEFAEFCQNSLRQLDPDVNAALITSFNEWYEGTILEPAEEWGTQRLETVQEHLSTAEETHENRDRYGTITIDFESLVPEEDLNPDAGMFARDLGFQLYELTLLDGEENEVEVYDIGSNEEPYFTEGAFGPEEHEGETWRWLGGPTGRSSFKIDWETLSPVRELRLRGRPPNHPDTVSAHGAIDTLGSTEITFESGRSQYSVTFPNP